MRYTCENDISEVVRTFEDASIARGKWTHAEHLVVALYYLKRHDFDTAVTKMRNGLFNLLVKGFGVDLAKEMPYHETLTVFWMRAVADFTSAKNGKPILDVANELVATMDKDYPLRFYTRELLFSDRARTEFVDPDL